MACPRCGARAPLGKTWCDACGFSYTWQMCCTCINFEEYNGEPYCRLGFSEPYEGRKACLSYEGDD